LKLFPRSVKVALLGYFGYDGYKLLEKNTGVVFRSHDVIFEEGTTNYAKQLTPTSFTDENNPFPYRLDNQTQVSSENRSNNTMGELDQKLIRLPLQVIAPQPSIITELHKDKHEEITSSATQTSDRLTYRLPPNDYEPQYNDDNTPLAVRRPQQLPKPTN